MSGKPLFTVHCSRCGVFLCDISKTAEITCGQCGETYRAEAAGGLERWKKKQAQRVLQKRK